MQHERLAVNPHADPFNVAVNHGLAHLELDHVSLDCTVVEGFANCVVVKVAARQLSSTSFSSIRSENGRRTESRGTRSPTP